MYELYYDHMRIQSQRLSISPHQYILELCRSEQFMDPDFILSHLDQIKSPHPTLVYDRVYSLDQSVSNNVCLLDQGCPKLGHSLEVYCIISSVIS